MDEQDVAFCPHCGASKPAETADAVFPGPDESGAAEAEGGAEDVPEWLAAVRRSDESDLSRGRRAGPLRTHNYLFESILVTLFCCLPFGIVAIAFAAQVNGHVAAGNHRAAMSASQNARTWCWVSFACGLAAGAGWLLVLFSNF